MAVILAHEGRRRRVYRLMPCVHLGWPAWVFRGPLLVLPATNSMDHVRKDERKPSQVLNNGKR